MIVITSSVMAFVVIWRDDLRGSAFLVMRVFASRSVANLILLWYVACTIRARHTPRSVIECADGFHTLASTQCPACDGAKLHQHLHDSHGCERSASVARRHDAHAVGMAECSIVHPA